MPRSCRGISDPLPTTDPRATSRRMDTAIAYLRGSGDGSSASSSRMQVMVQRRQLNTPFPASFFHPLPSFRSLEPCEEGPPAWSTGFATQLPHPGKSVAAMVWVLQEVEKRDRVLMWCA